MAFGLSAVGTSKPAGQRSVSDFYGEDELRRLSVNVRSGSSLCENSARRSVGATIDSAIVVA